jgi:hypothetical protein
VPVSMPSRPWPGRDGDDRYPLPALLSAYRTDCPNQSHKGPYRRGSRQNWFTWSIAKSVHRITNVEESLHAKDDHAVPLHIGCAARAAPIAVAAGFAAADVWGGGGAKRGDQVVALVFGDAGLEIASLSTKKGSRSCENCSDWH